MYGGTAVSPQPRISPREMEVLRYLARGYTANKVARQLGVTVSTVHKHTAHLHTKFNVHNRVQLLQAARDRGLLP